MILRNIKLDENITSNHRARLAQTVCSFYYDIYVCSKNPGCQETFFLEQVCVSRGRACCRVMQ